MIARDTHAGDGILRDHGTAFDWPHTTWKIQILRRDKERREELTCLARPAMLV